MEASIGIKFNDFALIACDSQAVFSIMVVKHDCDKIYKLSDNLMMSACGEPGDSVQFAEFIAKNIQLFRMRSGFELAPKHAATYVQRNLADYLRSRTPYQTNLILAGYDKDTKTPELYWIDYLATVCEVPFAVHGYAQMFTLGLLDKNYRPDMNEEEAVELMKSCIKQIDKRFLGSLQYFHMKKVDADGVTVLPPISVKDLVKE